MHLMAPEHYTPFEISATATADRTVITPVGELDLASADRLADEVARARSGGPRRIVLDLRAVDFIDSTGLRLLLSLRNDAKRNGHSLALVAPRPAARRIFDITVTRELFDWVDDPLRP